MGTAEEVKWHFELLEEAVGAIEAGWVPMPVYSDNKSTEEGGSSRKKGSGRTMGRAWA